VTIRPAAVLRLLSTEVCVSDFDHHFVLFEFAIRYSLDDFGNLDHRVWCPRLAQNIVNFMAIDFLSVSCMCISELFTECNKLHG
jgi:hypothetical protein